MEQTWLQDARGNKCSVEYFGSKEAAQQALDSLVECDNCTNCNECRYCSDCSGCSDCSHVAHLYAKKNLAGRNPAVSAAPMRCYKTPWATAWTDRGESMGYDYDTCARIVDADGEHIVTIGRGSNIHAERQAEEALAAFIVSAVNAYEVKGP